jgi:hypothetical protein
MVNKVIDTLNPLLDGIVTSQIVYGLAETTIRLRGSVRVGFPGVIMANGEVKYVGIDDVKSIIIYHKLNSATTTALNNGKGDNPGDLVNAYSMSLLVYWDRRKLNLYPDELFQIIQARWPQVIMGIPDTKVVRIRISNSNMNSLQVFSQEYSYEDQKIPENVQLMQVNYTTEITFNPACITACP